MSVCSKQGVTADAQTCSTAVGAALADKYPDINNAMKNLRRVVQTADPTPPVLTDICSDDRCMRRVDCSHSTTSTSIDWTLARETLVERRAAFKAMVKSRDVEKELYTALQLSYRQKKIDDQSNIIAISDDNNKLQLNVRKSYYEHQQTSTQLTVLRTLYYLYWICFIIYIVVILFVAYNPDYKNLIKFSICLFLLIPFIMDRVVPVLGKWFFGFWNDLPKNIYTSL